MVTVNATRMVTAGDQMMVTVNVTQSVTNLLIGLLKLDGNSWRHRHDARLDSGQSISLQ